MNAIILGLLAAFLAIASVFFVLWSVSLALVVHILSWVLCFIAVIIKRHQSKVTQ
jgi:hypothetical protein